MKTITKEVIETTQPDFKEKIIQEGIWIAIDKNYPGCYVPLWAEDGNVYSVKKDTALSLDRFTPNTFIMGPFTDEDVK